MLNLTRLWCSSPTPGDNLRYGEAPAPDGLPPVHRVHHRPVMVWNITRRCNLHCAHCYIDAMDRIDPAELDTETALRVVDQLADYGVPVLLLSGGEPLMRPDILEIINYATSRGLRTVLSTNGTLLTAEVARNLQRAGVAYVGVSIDGPEAIHDKFRGSRGAFRQALDGVRTVLAEGLKVGLRFTLTRYNYQYLDNMFDMVQRERLPRLCIYHLAYAGRGARIASRAELSQQETRRAIDQCLTWAARLNQQGLATEVLTVDNHTDACYLALRLLEERPQQAREVLRLLLRNGGNASGVGIGAIGPYGDVHADQFSHHRSFGNVRNRDIGAIWGDTSHSTMEG
ncbi:MAG: radical SAM protein, partial [Dehalococcoidia bacterium]